METPNPDDHDDGDGSIKLANVKKEDVSKSLACCEKESVMNDSLELSHELRDRLNLKGVNGIIVNGIDSHKDESSNSHNCKETSSHTCAPNIVNCSVRTHMHSNSCAPHMHNCEESSGFNSRSHEAPQLSKLQRPVESAGSDIRYVSYESELQMPDIMRLIQKDLSEPYSIYTYRYFIHNWPKLCFLAMCEDKCVGAIVCKLDVHRKVIKRGYIAMLAVDEKHRKKRIGSNLVLKAIRAMMADDADEVVLETEITNRPALRLYENLGFVRDKRLFRYYLNGVDALRLKLWLR